MLFLFVQKKLELSKKDWELEHIQALKEEEERRAGAEDVGEPLDLTYTTEESRQVKKSKNKSSSSRKEKANSSSKKPQAKPSAGSQGSVAPRPTRSSRRSSAVSRGETVG